MEKLKNFLSMFGDEPDENDAQKIERIEKALEEKDATIKDLTDKLEQANKKVNSLKIDGLVKKVEPKVEVKEEEIVFDFDL